jgi:hypothetical protein
MHALAEKARELGRDELTRAEFNEVVAELARNGTFQEAPPMSPDEIAKLKSTLARVVTGVQQEASNLVFREQFDAIGHFRGDAEIADTVYELYQESALTGEAVPEDEKERLKDALFGLAAVCIQQIVFLTHEAESAPQTQAPDAPRGA